MKPNYWMTLLLLMTVACGGETEPEPEPVSLTGTWLGAVGSAAVAMKIADTDGTLTGMFDIVSEDGPLSGTLQGTFSDPDIKMDLMAGVATGTLTGMLASENEIRCRVLLGMEPEVPLILTRSEGS